MSRVIFDEVFQYESMENTLNVLYPLYQHYGWKWGDEIPDRERLRKRIILLAQDLIDNKKASYIATGRLLVYWSEEDCISVALDLSQFYLGND